LAIGFPMLLLLFSEGLCVKAKVGIIPELTTHAAAVSSLLACLLTAWCRIFFEKLIVTQLVKQ
jgi:hypothetical protein